MATNNDSLRRFLCDPVLAAACLPIARELCKSNPKAHSGARQPPESFAQHQIAKTKPMAHSGAQQPPDSLAQHQFAETKPMAHSGAQREAAAGQRSPIDESNSMAHSAPRPLTLRQLAALRLLVRGHGTMRVAQRLQINHHTISRWKKLPAFAAELERMTQDLQIKVTRVRPNSFIAQQRHLADCPDLDGPTCAVRAETSNLL